MVRWVIERTDNDRANEAALDALAWLVILAEFEVLLVVFGLVFGR